MVDIPPEIAIRATIKPGSVYYFPHEAFISSDPHYFIVINIDPLHEQLIILVCASSRIARVKLRSRNCPLNTLVQISPRQYPDFKVISIVDCNYIVEQTMEQLVERLLHKQLRLMAEMDIKLVEHLRQGVLDSPLVPQIIKNQLSRK